MENLIMSGKICPYCNAQTEFIDSSFVYGKSYGNIYICKPCDAYVGVHKGTNTALGRLANASLRNAKKKAHEAFDPLWQRKMQKGFSKKIARSLAYKWLSETLKIVEEECHIGMFNEQQCEQVIALCSRYL